MSEPVDPSVPAPAVSEQWFCDQCGARYSEPGECVNQHPPAELKPVSASVTPEQTGPATEDPAADVAAPADTPAEPTVASRDVIENVIADLEDILEQLKAHLG